MTDRIPWWRSLWWTAALAVLACSGTAQPRVDASGGATPEGHRVVHRARPADMRSVLVLPFNVLAPLPVALVGMTAPVFPPLVAHLEEHGFEVAEDDTAAAGSLWRTCQEGTRDPASGEHTWSAAGRCLALRLRELRSFDAIVVPTLIYQRVEITGASVSWDGVTRELRGFEQPLVSRRSRRRKPTVLGISLHAIVLDESGDELFHGVGGLEVLQEVARVERRRLRVHLRVREDLFQHSEPLREGISVAFDPFLPRPEPPPPTAPGSGG